MFTHWTAVAQCDDNNEKRREPAIEISIEIIVAEVACVVRSERARKPIAGSPDTHEGEITTLAGLGDRHGPFVVDPSVLPSLTALLPVAVDEATPIAVGQYRHEMRGTGEMLEQDEQLIDPTASHQVRGLHQVLIEHDGVPAGNESIGEPTNPMLVLGALPSIGDEDVAECEARSGELCSGIRFDHGDLVCPDDDGLARHESDRAVAPGGARG